MLYYINDSVGQQVKNGDLLTIEILSELLEAWKRNKCLIDASRDTFEIICKEEKLKGFMGPSRRKQGLRDIYKHLSFFVQLAADNDHNAKNIDGAQGRIIPIMSCYDIYFFSSNTLICENSHDYMFYYWAANYFQIADVKNTISLNTLHSNGGGSQTDYECSLYDQNKSLALVIYDNDKKYPGDTIGKTAKSIENKIAHLHSLYLWPHQISVHEIENLIPIDVLVGLKRKTHKDFLVKMAANRNDVMFESLFRYFDFKKGLAPSTLRAYKIAMTPEDFSKLTSLLAKLGAMSQNISKALRGSWDKKHIENVILGGWGDKLLQASVDYVYSNNNTYSLTPYQEIEWKSLIKDIWSIGCAQNKAVI